MSLRIEIVDPRPFYHPGDRIQGNVILDSKKSEDIAQVTVGFTGRCKVKIRRHDHYTTISHRTRGYYFRLQDILYEGGNYTFQSGTRSWPFRFTIVTEAESEDPWSQRPPGKRELDKVGILKRTDAEGLESDHFSSSPTWRGSYDSFRGRPDPHRLPDTFEYVSNRFPASCEARVEYRLTASLKRPTRGVLFPSKDLEASLDIVLRSRHHPQDLRRGAARTSLDATQIVKIDQNFAASQLMFNHGSKMSLLDRAAMNIFKPSDLRGVTVTISVILDRHFRSGGICPLLLRATKENSSDPAKESPMLPIKLRSYVLRLIARTALRAELEAVMVQDVNHHAVDRRVLLSGKGLNLDVPWSNDEEPATGPSRAPIEPLLDGWLDLSSSRPADESDRAFMTPTFKTYNINREYTLALEVKLECAGIKYDIKRENIDVTILAEEDHAENSNKEDVRGGAGVVELDGRLQTDSKVQHLSTDEKQGPVPPPPPSREAEPEQLPQYEPGDVPVYHAGEDSSRTSRAMDAVETQAGEEIEGTLGREVD